MMDVNVNFVAGASIIKLKPTFSTNGDNVFVGFKNTVHQYNTKTGKLVYKYTGWDREIIGMSFTLFDDEFETISACCESGKVLIFNVVTKLKLFQTRITKKNLTSFHVIEASTKNVAVLISYITKEKEAAFALVNTKNLKQQNILLTVPNNTWAIDVCKNKYFTIVVDHLIYFVSLKTFTIYNNQMAANNRTFTTVCCHPDNELVLTGDNTGRVVLWQNLFKTITKSVYHWHTLPVQAIAFSKLGSYFYSGADEGVLVKWHIDNASQRQFLPRLPAGIVQLAVCDNNTYLAAATKDNAIRVIDSRLNQVSLIQNLVLGQEFGCGLIYDPNSRALVMNGNVGCVQFFSTTDNSLLYNVDIVSQNKVTNERGYKLENTEIKKVALSYDGQWLASVEARLDGLSLKELSLKFWNFSSEQQNYTLNTCIEFPHEALINCIGFQPKSKSSLKCITVGTDKFLKIWELVDISTVQRTGQVWRCISQAFFRDLPCRGLSFSIDGSLFSTAFHNILTLWDTEKCELKTTLSRQEFKAQIKHIQFGQGTQCHLVAVACKSQLCVWNILTLTLSWVVNLSRINLLVADPLSKFMLVISRERKSKAYKFYVFEPGSSSLLFTSGAIKKGRIVDATFVPRQETVSCKVQWYEKLDLYFLTSYQELYRMSKREDYQDETFHEDLSEEMSVFKKLKPKLQSTDVKSQVKQHMFPIDMGYSSFRAYLEAPIETLPPITQLAGSLLKSMLLQRQ